MSIISERPKVGEDFHTVTRGGSSPSAPKTGMWCNGSTRVSKAFGLGSTPSFPAMVYVFKYKKIGAN